MSVTIKDVAKKAGVSPSTVSRVITNHPRISVKTVQKVKQVMKELGYHPNIMAKSLVSKTTKTLGIILPRPAEELFQNLFFAEVIRGLVTMATKGGYDLLMTSGTNDEEQLEAAHRLVKGRRVDGIILLQAHQHDPIIHFLTGEDFPFVLIGRSEEFAGSLCVDTNNIQAAYDATRHLIAQGHERIGFIIGQPSLVVTKDRLAGYKQAIAEVGLSIQPDWIVEGGFLQDSGYRAMSLIMNHPEPPTALLVIDDVVSFGVLRGLKELGFRVPDDVGIVSFNNISLSEMASPPITSIDIGIFQLGYTASHILMRKIQGEPILQTRNIIPHRLIIRESSITNTRIF